MLVDRVRDLQAQDPYLMKLRSKTEAGQQSNFTLRGDGTLVLGQRLCVPGVIELKKESWKRHTHHHMRCIQGVLRCIGLWKTTTGGEV